MSHSAALPLRCYVQVVINMNLEDIDMKTSEDGVGIRTSAIFPRMLLCLPDMSGIQAGYEDLAFWSHAHTPSTQEQRQGTITVHVTWIISL